MSSKQIVTTAPQGAFFVPGYGQAGYTDRLDYIGKVVATKTGQRLRWVRDEAVDEKRPLSMNELKQRERRAEWLRRQEHYLLHGKAPGPTIIKVKEMRR